MPVTVPPVSWALKVRFTEFEDVVTAPALITTLPVGGVVSVGAVGAVGGVEAGTNTLCV